MKQRQTWLLALLSILTFVMVPCLATAASSGQLELGVSYTDIVDNAARVNEYVKNGASDNIKEDGLAASIKLDLEATDGVSAGDLSADIVNSDNYSLETEFDAARIFKLDISLDSMQHIKDHDNLEHIGATMVGDLRAGQPTIFSDATVPSGYTTVPAELDARLYDPTLDAQGAYDLEIANDYIVTRREWKNEAELTIPQLPNITFHAGLRIEEREGLEQAIGMSKCDACHVNAQGKEINERTEDFTMGVTGKFGIATIEYEFLSRDFTEDGATPTRLYDGATTTHSADYLLYGAGSATELEYKKTPDSEKESHLLKARIDLPKSTSITASYVKADVESTKEPDASFSLEDDTLSTEIESFGAKLATKIGSALKLSVRGSTYEIDADSNAITFPERQQLIDLGTFTLPFTSATDEWVSAEERKTTEFGVDGVYRLARATTLRLGYEYENIERVEAELGETETHTFKAAVKSRINKTLSARVSYKYQDIDDPFGADHATGIYQIDGTVDDGSGLVYTVLDAGGTSLGDYAYWNVVYPERDLSATNQPDTVHEMKFNSTWSPSANMAATLFARVRYEENKEVNYEQTTYVPGASIWYAPTDKLNLTMSYTFNNQDTQNQACVGWYHG